MIFSHFLGRENKWIKLLSLAASSGTTYITTDVIVFVKQLLGISSLAEEMVAEQTKLVASAISANSLSRDSESIKTGQLWIT